MGSSLSLLTQQSKWIKLGNGGWVSLLALEVIEYRKLKGFRPLVNALVAAE